MHLKLAQVFKRVYPYRKISSSLGQALEVLKKIGVIPLLFAEDC